VSNLVYLFGGAARRKHKREEQAIKMRLGGTMGHNTETETKRASGQNDKAMDAA